MGDALGEEGKGELKIISQKRPVGGRNWANGLQRKVGSKGGKGVTYLTRKGGIGHVHEKEEGN